MVIGILGNCFILIVKAKCKGQFSNRCWIPFMNLTMSDLGCSVLIISGSVLAMLTGGQSSPWCEVVSLLKFAFITSSIGSIAVLSVQRMLVSSARAVVCLTCAASLGSWLTGAVFGAVPVIFSWVRFDPAEMLCAVFWERRYSDMLVYILCAFSICIFTPFIVMTLCSIIVVSRCNSEEEADLSDITPLLVVAYTMCYTPFVLSEVILLGRRDLSPSPSWLRTVSSIMSYLDCGINPLIYLSHKDFREAALALLWTKKPTPKTDPVLTAVQKLDGPQNFV